MFFHILPFDVEKDKYCRFTIRNKDLTKTHTAVQTTKIQRLKKKTASSKCQWILQYPDIYSTMCSLKVFEQVPTCEPKSDICWPKNITNEIKKEIQGVNNKLEQSVSNENCILIENVTEQSTENKYKQESKRLK